MIDRLERRGLAVPVRLLCIVLVGFVLVVLHRPTVCAQNVQETALARSLFEEGLAAADAERWDEAAERFGRAYALKPTPATAFNWAAALIEIGKLVEAGERLRAIARDPAADAGLRSYSEAKLADITPRIASLVVKVEGQSDDLAVTVDGAPMLRAAWGAAAPTDPGTHTVALVRDSEVLSSEQVILVDGERRELTLVAPVVAAPVLPPPAVVGPAPAAKRDEARKPPRKSWLLWTATGAAVVAGAVVTAILLSKDDPKAPAPVEGTADPAVIRW